MKHLLFSILFIVFGWSAIAQPATQIAPANAYDKGIVIVPSLEKPKNSKKVKEKDYAGYLLVYFKDQNQ